MLKTELKDLKPETYNGVGSMHKYWGKKPFNIVSKLIEIYTEKGDVVLDPFMGSGVAVVEALAIGRKAVGVDLNPFSSLLAKVSITKVDIEELKAEGQKILHRTKSEIKDVYHYPCDCNKIGTMISAVRDNTNFINRIKIQCDNCGVIERKVSNEDIERTKTQDSYNSDYFSPKQPLIHNSRINAKKGMTIQDLFTKRNMFVCSVLLKNINEVADPDIRDALLISFTANLPNASRLTPIIKQRGEMAPGAWMTGFYVGKDFLEQNVLWYFENRLKKTIKAKEEIERRNLDHKNAKILNINSESLKEIASSSIDFIFTDPPYGDAVPYFEQSLMYNSWLGFDVNYENEIVISDSKERKKTDEDYFLRIKNVFCELHRVLKPNRKMVLTFHNMDGDIWHSFAKIIVEAGFRIKDVLPLYQKTSTPRQLNRENSIKCDMVLSFEKIDKTKITELSMTDVENLALSKLLKKVSFSTDEAFSIILSEVYSKGIPANPLNISKLLKDNFVYEANGWKSINV